MTDNNIKNLITSLLANISNEDLLGELEFRLLEGDISHNDILAIPELKIDDLKHGYLELVDELGKANSSNSKFEIEIEELNRTIKDLEGSIEDLESELDDLESDLNDTKNILSEKESEIEDLETELEELKEQSERFEEFDIDHAKGFVDDAYRAIQELSDMLEDL